MVSETTLNPLEDTLLSPQDTMASMQRRSCSVSRRRWCEHEWVGEREEENGEHGRETSHFSWFNQPSQRPNGHHPRALFNSARQPGPKGQKCCWNALTDRSVLCVTMLPQTWWPFVKISIDGGYVITWPQMWRFYVIYSTQNVPYYNNRCIAQPWCIVNPIVDSPSVCPIFLIYLYRLWAMWMLGGEELQQNCYFPAHPSMMLIR